MPEPPEPAAPEAPADAQAQSGTPPPPEPDLPAPAPVLVPSAQVDPSGSGILAGPVFATAMPFPASTPATPFGLPALEASAVHVAGTAPRPPRVGETVSGALDLALAASRRVRRASIYIGLLTLALVGPVSILFLAVIRARGGFEPAMDYFGGYRIGNEGFVSLFGVATLIAAIGVWVVFIEGQIMATAIVGGAASGRRIGLRRSLRLSRRVFWKVVWAGFLVAILDRIVAFATAAVIGGPNGDSEAATVVEVALSGLATMPFGFYQAGIILGGVGATESLRRSVRIARARWRLAVVVALAGIILSYIEIFALGAGLDLVLRFADAAGLGFDASVPVATLSVLIVLACIVAVGSLIVTIAALVAAPQVFVFVKMTGYSAGLDRAIGPLPGETDPAAAKPPRLVTLPMIATIVLGFICAIVALPLV